MNPTIEQLTQLKARVAQQADDRLAAIDLVIELIYDSEHHEPAVPGASESVVPMPEPASASEGGDGAGVCGHGPETVHKPKVMRHRPGVELDKARAVLASLPKVWCAKDLKDALGVDTKAASNRITQLIKHGDVVRVSQGLYRVSGRREAGDPAKAHGMNPASPGQTVCGYDEFLKNTGQREEDRS